MKKYNILKAGLWYSIGKILISGVSFFMLPVFTSIMSTSDYGIYTTYISYLSIVEVFFLLGISPTVRAAKFSPEIDFETYMTAAAVIPIILALVSGGGINLYIAFFGSFTSMSFALWNIMFISACCAAIFNIAGTRLVIESRYILFMILSAVSTLVNIGISLILCRTVYRDHDTYMARVLGTVIAAALCAVVAAMMTVRIRRITLKYFKMVLVLSLPLLLHTASDMIMANSDIIVIKTFNGYSLTGIYGVAVTIMGIPLVIVGALENAWVPWFYDKLQVRDFNGIRRLNRKYILGFMMLIICFMLVSPEVVHVFTNSKYWDSIFCLFPLTISVFAVFLYNIPVNVEYYHKKSSIISLWSALAVILNIGMAILFVRWFGYVGAAYATAMSKILLFILHYISSRRIEKNKVMDLMYSLLSLCVVACACAVLTYLVDMIWIRYTLLVVTLGLLLYLIVRNKTDIMELVRK